MILIKNGTLYTMETEKPVFKDILIKNGKIAEISKNIDCVINCAAIVRHYGDYSEFERINVTGVQNLIDFCMKSMVFGLMEN